MTQSLNERRRRLREVKGERGKEGNWRSEREEASGKVLLGGAYVRGAGHGPPQ